MYVHVYAAVIINALTKFMNHNTMYVYVYSA